MPALLQYLLSDNRYMSAIGILVILGVAVLCSNNRKKINIRLVLTALGIQFLLALFILKTSHGSSIFTSLSHAFEAVYAFADKGTSFVFGNLADISGPWGMVFVIKVLPTIVFFGALMALLFHLGIVQLFVSGLAMVIRPLLGTSGAETLSVAANVMLGQTEAPLLIKNYLPTMTQSEMLVVMVGGMSHLSGSLLAVYGSMGVPIKHLLVSSFMAIPGAILMAKILCPEVEKPVTMSGSATSLQRESKNILDAVSKGTSDGLNLAVNVAAMLVSFISLMALVDYLLLAGTSMMGCGISLNQLFGKLFCGVAYLLSIPLQDCQLAGSLLGQKLVINEFVAYLTFAKSELLPRTQIILTYALAGFSNFSCIGIQIGGIGAICAEKRTMLTQLGMRALLGGTLTNLLSAAVVGLLL